MTQIDGQQEPEKKVFFNFIGALFSVMMALDYVKNTNVSTISNMSQTDG
jgi:hypothetical protein